MSRINIAFGTHMGGGPQLDEATPFVPDVLCDQCLGIFMKDITWSSYSPNTLSIDPESATACRLCARLISKFYDSETSTPIQIEYFIVDRYGYFIRVHDIIFRPVGSKAFMNDTVRLALQKMNPTDDDGDIPHMIHFESTLSPSTESNESMMQADKWFKQCLETHEGCTSALPKSNFVPSRLIEIRGTDVNQPSIRLQEKSSLPTSVSYATLGHCWGTSMPLKLTLQNLFTCRENIPMHSLTKVFQDAIHFAHRSGIKYIWIDSLCIVQDSPKDWASESSTMGSIYHHSILNIAATGFADGANGLFVKRDANLLLPIAVKLDEDLYLSTQRELDKGARYKQASKGNYYLVDAYTWKEGIDESPLCKRGWVAQERALSVRTLHFGKEQLFWECMCANASEVFPKGIQRGTMMQNPKVFLRPRDADKQKRLDQLQSTRNRILERQNADREFEESMRALRSQYTYLHHSSDDESEPDLTSDKIFARQMKATRTNGTQPVDEISESESDSDSNYAPKYSASGRLKKRKPYRDSVKDLGLVPGDFEGCDINILDNLNIKGWEKFKRELERLGIGLGVDRSSVLPIRGMTLEQQQWLPVVGIYTRCALTFAKDKLVAISGMARELSKDMDCEYLAGLWRRDLEHQVLWKVKGAHPATKKEDMRGPSWSWASVDGEIEILDWSGYFYSGIPGNITWLSKVDLARVRLAGTDEFGQVRSGFLHITGRLGVVKIDKDSTDNPDAGDGDLIQTKKQVDIYWDTKEVEEIFGKSQRNTSLRRYSRYGTEKGPNVEVNPLDVFCLPVRIMDADPDSSDTERPVLTGLLLLPTGKKGQFRRVGQFERMEHWDENELESLTETTRILDHRFFLSRQKHGEYSISIV